VLEAAIPQLVALVAQKNQNERQRQHPSVERHVHESKTCSNAAAAIGNLVRQSDTCVPALVRHEAPHVLYRCSLQDVHCDVKRIAIFSLGNLCEYPACRAALLNADAHFAQALQALHEDTSTDELVKKNIRRLLSKWDH
jgi:hypothetical protein